MKEEIKISEENTAILKVELDNQVATAKQYPRNEVAIISKVERLATIDNEIAADCFYAKPVGDGKIATGESIRFAEIVGSLWGNLRIRTSIKEETQKTITAVCEIHDLESNIALSCEVSRSVFGKYGRYTQTTIEVTKLAAQAIARRNGILQIIPKGIFKSTIERIKNASIEKTKKAGKDALKISIDKTFEAFKKLNVTELQILKSINVKSKNEITQENLTTLIGFGTSIKEKTATIAEIFEPETNSETKNPFKDEKTK